MEQKLEVKHLATYLPYGIKVTSPKWERDYRLHYDSHILNAVTIFDVISTPEAKLKLRPLLHITKEIEYKGKKFIPFIELSETYKKDLNFDDHDPKKIVNQSIILMKQYGYGHCQTWVFEKLCEWHFDVFGLIDKGLAVPLT